MYRKFGQLGALSFEQGPKEANPPTRDTQKGEYRVAPLMAGQMPVAVVFGGERQVDSHLPRPRPVVEATLCPPAAVSSTSFSHFLSLRLRRRLGAWS